MDSPDQRVALLLQRQLEHESLFNTDLYLAQKLQEDFNKEVTSENPTNLVYDHKTKATDDSRSLVDPSWELIDPTPNIHNLFVAFNLRFFWNKLLAVCVSWSKKMTSCAGVCCYQGRGGMCTITLSEPLLKLRPRKDLVETLLHEMIHAYLFVTHNNRDRDGHGPEFHKHMFRINKEAGTNITVYHSFHDEVRLYQQHWWRCNGPCQTRKPYFGMVRRAINRAPGPYDRWWSEHARTCGGTFIKVKEPEKKLTTSAKSRNGVTTILNKGFGDIRKFVTVTSKNNTSGIHELSDVNNPMQNNSIRIPIVGASNIHGYTNLSTPANNVVKQVSNGNMRLTGATTGGMKTKSNSNSTIVVNKKSNITNDSVTNIDVTKTEIKIFSGSGKSLISSGTSTATVHTDDYSVVRNHWVNKFPPSPTKLNKRSVIELSPSKIPKKQKTDKECTNQDKIRVTDTINLDDSFVSCPVCQKHMNESVLNEHLDRCLLEQDKKDEKLQQCFVCNKQVPQSSFRDHVNNCFENNVNDDEELAECEICNTWFSEKKIESHRKSCIETIFAVSDNVEATPGTSKQTNIQSKSSSMVQCSVCNNFVDGEELNRHKEQCILKLIDSINEEHCLNINNTVSQKVSCLVCNKMVLKEELNTHLDECMSGVFDDKDFDVVSTVENKPQESHDCDSKSDANKYNCPFCMDLYSELDMSGHLDQCLVGDDVNVNNKTILIDSLSSDEL